MYNYLKCWLITMVLFFCVCSFASESGAHTLVNEMLVEKGGANIIIGSDTENGSQKLDKQTEDSKLNIAAVDLETDPEITCLTANLGTDWLDLDKVSSSLRQKILTATKTDQMVVQGLYQAVKDVTEVLTYFGIDHWATGGTLRGAVRLKYGSPARGGMSPWSNDADFAVNQKDEEKLKLPAVAELFDKLGYGLCSDEDTIEPYVGYKVYAKKMVNLRQKNVPIFIDLFLSQREDDRYVLTRPLGRKLFKDSWYFSDEVEKKENYSFGEISIPGPSNVAANLSRNYGTEWYDLCLYHNSHFGKVAFKYKWTFQSDEERRPALPLEPLEERLKLYLVSEEGMLLKSKPVRKIKYFLDQ